MRLLHTSDWHLGRSFLGVGMLTHQAAFVDHLLEVVESERVDLVVLSGDVYDRALPPVEAVELFEDALVRLADSRAEVVVTSGNHDSALRLGFASRLIDQAGVHLRTHSDGVGVPVLLHDEHGEVAVHGIPYLEPDHLREPWQLSARSHAAALVVAMERVRADLATRTARSVVLAHAFVADAAADLAPSESERDISVGGVQLVPLATFAGADYVALGHLHGRHTLSETVRYSGSPLAYSFSEAGHTKGCWLVDLGPSGMSGAEFVAAPVPRPLARLRGTLEELLTSPRHAGAEGAWVQASLTDDVRPPGALPRLQRRFPHLLSLAFEPSSPSTPALPSARFAPGRSDHEIALDFVHEVRGRVADEAESALLLAACEHVAREV
ncbi:exonuclease SbcCD subunit D [Nocardioides mangrovicus]|uniref:Nuclease SbcCD subunit D n=1 Tax=Nocardioides mangrovicus TaxID=2478913 RepID=A0A3L8P211_9ACTN|nr:exonuclease SbcCD subunit D [Nocardioides mangrovicus]RLV48659.1 exonuclease SbcCD subunit D [Nocardioides mangrovicus]